MEVQLYTQDGCPPCDFIKMMLKENNISYQEFNVSRDSKAKHKMMNELDSFSTPTLVIGNEIVRGAQIDQIMSLLNIK
jgi:glutaredoxin